MFFWMFIIIPLVLWLFFGAGAAKGWLKFCVILLVVIVGAIIGFILLSGA